MLVNHTDVVGVSIRTEDLCEHLRSDTLGRFTVRQFGERYAGVVRVD